MTLNGFAHALKIWILEMFPACRQNFTKRSDRLIRGTKWDRDAVLSKSACIGIFNSVLSVVNAPYAELRPTQDEQQSSWFRRSVAFFESSAGRRPTKRSRRRGPDLDDNDDDDDEDDDDGTRRQAPPSSSYQAPPSSSYQAPPSPTYQAPPSPTHHRMPDIDPYQDKWEYMTSVDRRVRDLEALDMDRRIRELEALTAHLRHTHVSTNMAPTYTSPGQMHGYTGAAYATTSSQRNVGMTSMTPSYTSPGYTQAAAGGHYPFSTPSSQQNFGMTSTTPAYTSSGYTQAATGGNYPFSTPSFQQNFGMQAGDYYRPQMMEPGPGLSVISGLVVVGILRICKSTLGLE
ncbi:hypothetical protein L6452_08246 [Arctium lappa]|uniref:Uncharacterized protein n=1 Tax=Arctium lappa TaxID=4217 RepID=A0ACB9DH63_ARCLA|nr:hypothetical protein L6452_08246 [Arctium lappa]